MRMNSGPIDHFFSAVIANVALTFVMLLVALLVGNFVGKRIAKDHRTEGLIRKFVTVVLSFILVYFFVLERLANT